MLQRLREIPCSDFDVCFRVEQILRNKSFHPQRLHPILRRGFGHLHEAAFAMGSEFLRLETAFLPDDRFDQQRIDAVARGGGGNERVLRTVASEARNFGQAVDRILVRQHQGSCRQRKGDGGKSQDVDPARGHQRTITARACRVIAKARRSSRRSARWPPHPE